MEIIIKGEAAELAAYAEKMKENELRRHDEDTAEGSCGDHLAMAVELLWKLHGEQEQEKDSPAQASEE